MKKQGIFQTMKMMISISIIMTIYLRFPLNHQKMIKHLFIKCTKLKISLNSFKSINLIFANNLRQNKTNRQIKKVLIRNSKIFSRISMILILILAKIGSHFLWNRVDLLKKIRQKLLRMMLLARIMMLNLEGKELINKELT